MIVVDENLDNQRLIADIKAWYPGQVVAVTSLRPLSVVKDEAVATLLHRADQPTFITINANDFWKKFVPHRNYCIIAFVMPKEHARELPALLKRLLRLAEFKTKAARMGKVIRLTPTRIEYYESDRHIQSVSWSP